MPALSITIRFLDARFHGSEWPPSPARLFQALLAGARTGAAGLQWSSPHQQALEWIESLSAAPSIFACPVRKGQRYQSFVPNNSVKDGALTKTGKTLAPTLLHRQKPDAPDLIYRWPLPEIASAAPHAAALDEIAARLLALGWGLDLATATVHLSGDDDLPQGLEAFEPAPAGSIIRAAPQSGTLAHLEERYGAFRRRITAKGIDPYTRPTRFATVRYQRAAEPQPRRHIAFAFETPDGEPLAVPWQQAQTAAAWLRAACRRALLEEDFDSAWVDHYVSGHTPEHAPGHRLSFVPLPSVGHAHSDGAIRRVLIAAPPGATGRDLQALDWLGIKLTGWLLTAEGASQPHAALAPIADPSKVLPFYLEPARVWQTVTPVILHGHNAQRGRISLTKTGRLLHQAFEASGIPGAAIAGLTFQTAPLWPGCGAAAEVRTPRHLEGWPRLHVQVEFHADQSGPILAGLGRHYGLGLFAGVR